MFIEVVYIDESPALLVVDEGTRFSAACFLSSATTAEVWSAMLTCWATVYTGLPNRILVDQGSNLGDLFADFAAVSNVTVESAGIEALASLGISER